MRVDDQSYRKLVHDKDGLLPASYDGHIALYRTADGACVCAQLHEMDASGVGDIHRT